MPVAEVLAVLEAVVALARALGVDDVAILGALTPREADAVDAEVDAIEAAALAARGRAP